MFRHVFLAVDHPVEKGRETENTHEAVNQYTPNKVDVMAPKYSVHPGSRRTPPQKTMLKTLAARISTSRTMPCSRMLNGCSSFADETWTFIYAPIGPVN